MGAQTTLQSGPDLAAHWPQDARAHATINFAHTALTWPAILAATRPLGRIVAVAMVAEPAPLVQEWLIWTGVTITETSVGTRAQMRDLMDFQAAEPLESHAEVIGLEGVSEALLALHQGRAKGRYCIVF